MLTVNVQNFQSIAAVKLLIKGFTVVTGQNNSGKSALIRAIRGALQNTRGTSFIRHGSKTTTVKLEMDDGHTLEWSKGTAKGAKPTYHIDGGDAIHPGQSVPDEVRDLGIVPITAGGREVWPQVAPQFTGQVFLLDQPGSVLAEAVADVERVGQLNGALRLAESDKRAASSELKVRKADIGGLEAKLDGFKGLEDVEATLVQIEQAQGKALTIERAVSGLTDLHDRHTGAKEAVGRLSGIEDVNLPGDEPFEAVRVLLGEKAGLEGLAAKHSRLDSEVTRLSGVEEVGVDIDFTQTERRLAALDVMRGMQSRYLKATKKVTDTEQELADAESALDAVTQEFTETLGGLGECPVCGSTLAHEHGGAV